MKEFTGIVTEVLEAVVSVRAKDAGKAEEIQRDRYRRGEIVLSSDDFTGTDFIIKEN